MANITVSVPDDVYRAARINAAEKDTSVSALVADYLRSLSERDAEFARREALWEEVRSKIGKGFKASDNLSREELYDRAARRAEADEARARALRGITEAARAFGCEVVLSEDLSDGQDYDGVRVENPFSDC